MTRVVRVRRTRSTTVGSGSPAEFVASSVRAVLPQLWREDFAHFELEETPKDGEPPSVSVELHQPSHRLWRDLVATLAQAQAEAESLFGETVEVRVCCPPWAQTRSFELPRELAAALALGYTEA